MSDPGQESAPSERKLVTALFADLSGSLGIITGRDPEQADEILSNVIALMEAEITRYGGVVTQVMGDGTPRKPMSTTPPVPAWLHSPCCGPLPGSLSLPPSTARLRSGSVSTPVRLWFGR